MEKEVKQTTENKTTKTVNTKRVSKKTINNTTEKFDIGMENKSIIENAKELFTKHMKMTTLVVFIIAASLFTAAFFSKVGGPIFITDMEEVAVQGFFEQVGYLAMLDLVVMIAGLTPYFFLSAIGLLEAMAIVGDMQMRAALSISTKPTLFIGGLIQMVGLSIIIAAGMYYCLLSTKKNRYYSKSTFGMSDIKKQYYSLKNDEKKLEELAKKEEEKEIKIEKLNVKIPYLSFLCIYVFTLIIQVVGLIITKI